MYTCFLVCDHLYFSCVNSHRIISWFLWFNASVYPSNVLGSLHTTYTMELSYLFTGFDPKKVPLPWGYEKLYRWALISRLNNMSNSF